LPFSGPPFDKHRSVGRSPGDRRKAGHRGAQLVEAGGWTLSVSVKGAAGGGTAKAEEGLSDNSGFIYYPTKIILLSSMKIILLSSQPLNDFIRR